MSILGRLADSGLAVLTGGATGLVRTAIEAVSGHFKAKQAHQEKLELAREERATLELEIQGQNRIAQIHSESEKQISDNKAYIASTQSDQATYSSKSDSGWLVAVDVVRGFTRPVLTFYLVGLLTFVYITTPDFDLKKLIVNAVIYLSITGVVWWYGGKRINHSSKTAQG